MHTIIAGAFVEFVDAQDRATKRTGATRTRGGTHLARGHFSTVTQVCHMYAVGVECRTLRP
jgi:hypothetical protein